MNGHRALKSSLKLCNKQKSCLTNSSRIRASSATGDGWELIQQAVLDILSKNVGSIRFETVYRAAYSLVSRNRGERLYVRVKELLRDHLENEVKLSLERKPSKEIGRALNGAISDYVSALAMIRDILLYLEAAFIPANNLPRIKETGIQLFTEIIIYDPSLQSFLCDGIAHMTDSDLSVIFSMFLALNVDRNCSIMKRVLQRLCTSGNQKKSYRTTSLCPQKSVRFLLNSSTDSDTDTELLAVSSYYDPRIPEENNLFKASSLSTTPDGSMPSSPTSLYSTYFA